MKKLTIGTSFVLAAALLHGCDREPDRTPEMQGIQEEYTEYGVDRDRQFIEPDPVETAGADESQTGSEGVEWLDDRESETWGRGDDTPPTAQEMRERTEENRAEAEVRAEAAELGREARGGAEQLEQDVRGGLQQVEREARSGTEELEQDVRGTLEQFGEGLAAGAEDVEQEVTEETADLREDWRAEIETVSRETRARIADIEQQLTDLQPRLQALGEDVQREARQTADGIADAVAEIETRLDEAPQMSEEQWSRFRTESDERLERAEQDLDTLREQVRRGSDAQI